MGPGDREPPLQQRRGERIVLTRLLAILLLAAGVASDSAPARAKDRATQRTRAELALIHEVLARHRKQAGEFPADALALSPVLRAYAASIPQQSGRALDAWGTPYVYRRVESERGYVIYSAGSNRTDDRGSGDDLAASPPEPTHPQAGADARRRRALQVFPVLALVALAPIAWGAVRLARRRYR